MEFRFSIEMLIFIVFSWAVKKYQSWKKDSIQCVFHSIGIENGVQSNNKNRFVFSWY